MSNVKTISTGILISVFALGGLAGCASGDETTRQEDEVAEQSVGEEWEEAGEATAEATEDTVEEVGEETEGLVQKTESTAQKAEAKSKDAGERTHVTAERAEKQIEQWIGGGPPQSDTQSKIDEVERELANYKKGIEQQGYKPDAVMRMRMQQVEERIDLLKSQYQSLAQEANWGVAEIDANFEGFAEDIEDEWDDIEDQLEVELGRSYEKMDD